MAVYEYRCDRCGNETVVQCGVDEAPTHELKNALDGGGITCVVRGCPGSLKRRFGFRLSRYSVTEKPGTADERTFTTEAAYTRYLKSQSLAATDRTGIPHDFVPVDLMDESVRPANHEQLLREAQLAQGADKKIAPMVVPSKVPSSD